MLISEILASLRQFWNILEQFWNILGDVRSGLEVLFAVGTEIFVPE